MRAHVINREEKKYLQPELMKMEDQWLEIISADDLYELIHSGVPLKIDSVCVQGFSMAEYRKKYGIPKDEIVNINFDSIINCLFCGGNDNIAADFSFCNFVSSDEIAGIMFDDNIFYCGKVDFSYSQIGNVDFSLKGSHFINCNVNFSYAVFGNRDFYFNETVFDGKCEIKFTGTDFGKEGEITFSYMSGIDGSVDFYKCNFGENVLNFTYMNCPKCQFSFWDIETPAMPIDFVDSIVEMILLYKVNVNGLLDFRIALAKHIVIQESVIRDCVLLGNQGYKNCTCYCLKKSTLLGKVRIQNKFSNRLFSKQLQYAYDEVNDEIVLCPTSSTDKANQLVILSENFWSEGETDNADAAYVLSKRYRSRGRVHDIWTDYSAVKRTEELQKSFIKRFWAYVLITIRLIEASISWLFEKIFLDILCGNYATKPSKFLFWILAIVTGFAWIYHGAYGLNVAYFEMQNVLYQTMESWKLAWIYSLQVFLQIESGDLLPSVTGVYYFMVTEKLIGLAMFSVFVVSYTRKIIK